LDDEQSPWRNLVHPADGIGLIQGATQAQAHQP
jgi:hypothetical protein